MQKMGVPNWLIVLLLTSMFFLSKAQNEISSPYSGFGVGALTNISSGPLAAMGGTSYAMQNPYLINFRNPASYCAFDSLSILIDASMSIISGKLVTQNQSQQSTIGRFNYLLFGLPVTKIWRTSVGVLPFSDLGYSMSDSKNIDNIGQINYQYQASGGLMQLYWGNAFKLFKGFSIGVNLSYLFGSQNVIRYATFPDDNNFNMRVEDNNRINGLYISAGAQYLVKMKPNHTLGLGFVYENSAYIATRRDLLVNSYQGDYSPLSTYDTISFVNQGKGQLCIPQSIGGGVSYNFKDKVIVGFDATWQNWSNYALNGTKDSTLRNALLFSAGIQFMPDPTSGKIGKRICLRIGAKYSTGYFAVRGMMIPEYSICAGIGVPIKTYSTTASVNLMIEYGQMGTTKNALIRQDVIKFTLNFILQEKWYQRVKLN